MKLFRGSIFFIILGLIAGLSLGLIYSWQISPVTYVDANPAILRADFKDKYRIVIAAAYSSSLDLARARARLDLLSDKDPIGELSAQAQRMAGAGESIEDTQLLAKLATDLQQGYASNVIPGTPVVITSFVGTPFVAVTGTQGLETPNTEGPIPTVTDFLEPAILPTLSFEQTPLVPQGLYTPTPRPIPTQGINIPFTLVGQETVCDKTLSSGLLQFILMDSHHNQAPGIQIIVTWDEGEDSFFTGFKTEIGDGYADFIMQADTVYSIRVVDGGSFVPNISVPACTDSNGENYLGGILLTFQQP
jgi:hypothetical protein